MNLLEEINRLRMELKYSRNRIRDLEATLGINRKGGNRAREILEKITGHRPNPVVVQELVEANQALHQQSHFMHMLQDRIRLGPDHYNVNNAEALTPAESSEASTPLPNCLMQPLPPINSRPNTEPGARSTPGLTSEDAKSTA